MQLEHASEFYLLVVATGPNGTVAKSLANGLVGKGFISQYQLEPRTGFLKAQSVGVRPLHSLLSH